LAALRKCEEKQDDPINGGHRFAVQSSSDVYSWADAVKLDKITGEPIWICQRDGYVELKKKATRMGYLGRYSGGNDIRGFHERERELNTKVRFQYLFIPPQKTMCLKFRDSNKLKSSKYGRQMTTLKSHYHSF